MRRRHLKGQLTRASYFVNTQLMQLHQPSPHKVSQNSAPKQFPKMDKFGILHHCLQAKTDAIYLFTSFSGYDNYLSADRFQCQLEALLTFAGLVLQLVGCYSMTPLLSINIMFFSRKMGRTELKFQIDRQFWVLQPTSTRHTTLFLQNPRGAFTNYIDKTRQVGWLLVMRTVCRFFL